MIRSSPLEFNCSNHLGRFYSTLRNCSRSGQCPPKASELRSEITLLMRATAPGAGICLLSCVADILEFRPRGTRWSYARLLPFLLPLSVLLFEPDTKSRRRMLPFLVLGGATALYILWALTAYPLQVYVRGNSIVYVNQATNKTAVALLYMIATCGSLFLSKIRTMVVFGAANLMILLVVMEFKRYAFTSLWCAYAAIASLIILAYFWRSSGDPPFLYA